MPVPLAARRPLPSHEQRALDQRRAQRERLQQHYGARSVSGASSDAPAGVLTAPVGQPHGAYSRSSSQGSGKGCIITHSLQQFGTAPASTAASRSGARSPTGQLKSPPPSAHTRSQPDPPAWYASSPAPPAQPQSQARPADNGSAFVAWEDGSTHAPASHSRSGKATSRRSLAAAVAAHLAHLPTDQLSNFSSRAHSPDDAAAKHWQQPPMNSRGGAQLPVFPSVPSQPTVSMCRSNSMASMDLVPLQSDMGLAGMFRSVPPTERESYHYHDKRLSFEDDEREREQERRHSARLASFQAPSRRGAQALYDTPNHLRSPQSRALQAEDARDSQYRLTYHGEGEGGQGHWVQQQQHQFPQHQQATPRTSPLKSPPPADPLDPPQGASAARSPPRRSPPPRREAQPVAPAPSAVSLAPYPAAATSGGQPAPAGVASLISSPEAPAPGDASSVTAEREQGELITSPYSPLPPQHFRMADEPLQPPRAPAPGAAAAVTVAGVPEEEVNALRAQLAALVEENRALQREREADRMQAEEDAQQLAILRDRNDHLERINKSLQDTAARSSNEAAAALRQSGGELAEQWQKQKELEIRLQEQTALLHSMQDDMRRMTGDLRQRDSVIEDLRAKLRQKNHRLQEVAALAAVRHGSLSPEAPVSPGGAGARPQPVSPPRRSANTTTAPTATQPPSPRASPPQAPQAANGVERGVALPPTNADVPMVAAAPGAAAAAAPPAAAPVTVSLSPDRVDPRYSALSSLLAGRAEVDVYGAAAGAAVAGVAVAHPDIEQLQHHLDTIRCAEDRQQAHGPGSPSPSPSPAGRQLSPPRGASRGNTPPRPPMPPTRSPRARPQHSPVRGRSPPRDADVIHAHSATAIAHGICSPPRRNSSWQQHHGHSTAIGPRPLSYDRELAHNHPESATTSSSVDAAATPHPSVYGDGLVHMHVHGGPQSYAHHHHQHQHQHRSAPCDANGYPRPVGSDAVHVQSPPRPPPQGPPHGGDSCAGMPMDAALGGDALAVDGCRGLPKSPPLPPPQPPQQQQHFEGSSCPPPSTQQSQSRAPNRRSPYTLPSPTRRVAAEREPPASNSDGGAPRHSSVQTYAHGSDATHAHAHAHAQMHDLEQHRQPHAYAGFEPPPSTSKLTHTHPQDNDDDDVVGVHHAPQPPLRAPPSTSCGYVQGSGAPAGHPRHDGGVGTTHEASSRDTHPMQAAPVCEPMQTESPQQSRTHGHSRAEGGEGSSVQQQVHSHHYADTADTSPPRRSLSTAPSATGTAVPGDCSPVASTEPPHPHDHHPDTDARTQASSPHRTLSVHSGGTVRYTHSSVLGARGGMLPLDLSHHCAGGGGAMAQHPSHPQPQVQQSQSHTRDGAGGEDSPASRSMSPRTAAGTPADAGIVRMQPPTPEELSRANQVSGITCSDVHTKDLSSVSAGVTVHTSGTTATTTYDAHRYSKPCPLEDVSPQPSQRELRSGTYDSTAVQGVHDVYPQPQPRPGASGVREVRAFLSDPRSGAVVASSPEAMGVGRGSGGGEVEATPRLSAGGEREHAPAHGFSPSPARPPPPFSSMGIPHTRVQSVVQFSSEVDEAEFDPQYPPPPPHHTREVSVRSERSDDGGGGSPVESTPEKPTRLLKKHTPNRGMGSRM